MLGGLRCGSTGINMLAQQTLKGCCCMPTRQITCKRPSSRQPSLVSSFCGVLSAVGYGHGGVVHFHGVRLWKDNPSGSGRREFVRGFLALVNHEDGSVSGGLSVYKPATEMLTCLEVVGGGGGMLGRGLHLAAA